jgi:hypothetical protein
MLNTSAFKLNKFKSCVLSKNKNAFLILIIEIVSPKLSLKKILLSFISILFSENFMLLNSFKELKSLLNNEKLALLILIFFIFIFSLSKKLL